MRELEMNNASSILSEFRAYLMHGKEKGLTRQMIEEEQEQIVERLEDSMNSYVGIELANCFLKKGKINPADLKDRMVASIGVEYEMTDPQENLETLLYAKDDADPKDPDYMNRICAETFTNTFLSNLPYDVYDTMYQYLNMVEDSPMSYVFAQRELTNEIAIHESLMVAHAINEALVISYYGKETKDYQDYYADLCRIAAHWDEDYHTPEGKMLWVNCEDRYTLVKELFDGFFASIPHVLEFCIWELEETLLFL